MGTALFSPFAKFLFLCGSNQKKKKLRLEDDFFTFTFMSQFYHYFYRHYILSLAVYLWAPWQTPLGTGHETWSINININPPLLAAEWAADN